MEVFNSFGNWELCKKLGAGGFGEVILWRNRTTRTEIATKSLNRNTQLGTDEIQKLKDRWSQEIEFMRSLNADYIVRMLQLGDQAFVEYLNARHAWHPLPVLIMEYCNGGDLRTHLNKIDNLNGMCEFEVREVLRTLRNAVDYMHNKCNIKHRDLKPDNIVIHKMENGKKVYKLTDFGFARYINDQTMLQSVVGTRNYFAPEIVDSGGYTKTVDYWSVGVMAFEMLCGILPFIPHQSLYNKINQIRCKPNDCIAITEDLNTPLVFHFHKNIFDENRVSSVFRHEIEKWLRSSLDINHRTRGTSLADVTEVPDVASGRIFRFYRALDAALDMRILTIFCLNTCSFYYYKVDEATTLKELLDKTERDTGINRNKQCFILPVGHPLKAISRESSALDCFVQEWCDTSDSTNPPVMLYIADISNSFQIQPPKISALIQRCFAEPYNVDNSVDEAPTWIVQKFALDINFLVKNEERHLVALLDGLQQYAIFVEHLIFEFEIELQSLFQEAYELKGIIMQFIGSLKAVLKTRFNDVDQKNIFLDNWQQKIDALKNESDIILTRVLPPLQTRYKSALRRMNELATAKFYEDIIKKDIYGIAHFQRHLQESHLKYKFEELLEKTRVCNKCRGFIHDILKERLKFFENKLVIGARTQISDILKEFQLIKKNTLDSKEFIKQWKAEIEDATLNFYTELLSSQTAPLPPTTIDTHMIGSTINEICNSFEHLMDIPTKDLIQETHESLRLMSMDLDQPENSIPPGIWK